MSIIGQTKEAINFLKLVLPSGPWALTAIFPDKKQTKTETFYPNEEKKCFDFIELHNGHTNLYWHVNPVMRAMTKKAMREDIKEVVQFHVDIDPRAGEDFSKEQERILKLLQNPPNDIPPPSFIIFSGGGYQGFWVLQEPIEINGDINAAEDAKLYNITLERVFGADNCHNIDRLCRLPGTVNIPDAKKRKKGRSETLSKLISHHPSRVYEIKQFKKAQQVQSTAGGFSSSAKSVVVSGNIKRIDSVEDLNEWDVPDRVKVIIVQGSDVENPKQGDNSRSAWLFDCICQLVRAKVPDDVIFSIITDPDFRISESILEQKSSAEKYAMRQIERAKEFTIDPWLQLLNERHAVIQNLGGKCRVIEEIMDPTLNRTRITKQSFDDFRNSYMNHFVTIGHTKDGSPVKKSVGKWWLEHEHRRQFRTIVFAPGREVVDAYNLWKGFACQASPEGNCQEFLDHVKYNICSGNEEHYKYLLGWMARCVQQPDSAGQVAIVMRGGMGTGKGFFASQFGALFGRHFLQVADPKHLVGSFNAHLRDTVVLFGDEAFYAGDKKHESVLRMLITEESLAIEAKGIDVEVSPNFVHVLLASNNSWVVPAGADERRFFVLDVSDNKKQNIQYFSDLKKKMNDGGREALLYYLLNYDISNFEVRSVPKTKALNEQKLLSMTPEEEWWYNKLEEGRILPEHEKWEKSVIKEELFLDYTNYVRRYGIRHRANRTTLGKFLHKIFPNIRTYQKQAIVKTVSPDGFFIEKKMTPYFYEFPSLEDSRKYWEKVFGDQIWPVYEKIKSEINYETDEIPF